MVFNLNVKFLFFKFARLAYQEVLLMIYILITILLFISILGYFKIADHYNIIDHPNERSSHSEITIRGGGDNFCFSRIGGCNNAPRLLAAYAGASHNRYCELRR